MQTPLDRLPRQFMRLLRALIAPVWWVALIAISLSASVAFHFDHPLTRIVARDLTNELVSDLIVGGLEIGTIDTLETDQVIAHDVRYYDADGRVVIEAEEVEVGLDLLALPGTLRFSRGIIRRGTVTLLAGETALPSLIESFSAATPSDGEGPSLHAIVDGLSLEDVHLEGELLGLEGMDVPSLDADGRLEALPDGTVVIDVNRARGTLVEPYPFLGHVDRLSARIDTNPLNGLLLRAEGRVEREDGPTDRLAVRVTYKVPEGGEPDDPQELEILVHADPAEAQILSELRFEWAELFDSRLEGWFRLAGDPEETLALSVDAESEGGPVHLTGTIGPDGGVVVEGRTDGLALADVVRGAPELTLAGSAQMEIEGDASASGGDEGADADADGRPPRVSVQLEPLLVDGWAVPALRAEGVLLEDRVRIDEVTAPYAGGRLRGSGEVTFEGAADLRVRGTIPNLARDRNVRRVFPDARGSATIDARLRTFGVERSDLDFSGTIVLRDVRYGELSASYLRLEGFARGDISRPRLRLDIEGQDLAVAGYSLGATTVDLAGGPSVYEAKATFRSPEGRRLNLATEARREGQTWALIARTLEYEFEGGTWIGSARRIVVDPDRFVEIEGARLENGTQRLEGWGTFRFNGPDELSGLLVDFDLAALRALVGDAIPEIGGRADAHVRLSGDVLQPVLLIEGALRHGQFEDLSDISASYLIEYADGNLQYDASMDLGARGSLSAVGTGLLDPGIPNPFDALEGGIYDVELDVRGLDLDVVRRLAETALPVGVRGHLQGRLHASGPIFAPNLDAELGVYRLIVPGMSPLNVTTELTYENGALVGSVRAADERGQLVRADGSVLIDLMNLLRNPDEAIESLTTLPWTVDVKVPARRIANLPPEVRSYIPREFHPFRVDIEGSFAGGGYASRADVVANAEWTGPALAPLCQGAEHTRLTVLARFRDGMSTLRTGLFDGQTSLGFVEMSAPTPLDAWLAGTEDFTMPPTQAHGVLERALAERLPYACEYARGPVMAVVNVENLFTNQPLGHVELLTSSLSILGTSAVRADVELDVDSTGAHLNADTSWWSGERAAFEVAVPVTWNAAEPVPVPDGSDILLRADFEAAPLGPFVSWIPQIAFANGHLSGSIESRGALDNLQTTGTLEVTDGYLELRGLGQHLHDISGAVDFRGNWARLREVRARDGDGSIRIDGSVGFDGWFPSRVRVALNSDEFPVRSEGSVLATLSGSAGIEASVTGDQTAMDVEVRSLNVQLPDDSSRTLQSLDQHPDLRIVGRASDTDEDDEPYPFQIHIDAQQPFWVRRNDFAAQVTADLSAVYRDPDLFLSGYTELRRGFFEVFGKRFEIENGSMNFDGANEIDPEVNLVAVHHMRTPPNTDVTVIAHGTLTAPEIEFSSNHRDCDERAEIISMLVSGRCGTPSGDTTNLEFNAYEQASDFLAGIAAGLLTLTARKEFGDLLPVIVIESGDQGLQGARARIGFQANDYIPDFLADVVRGAYIEGTLTNASGGSDNNASLLPGVLIELSFPYSLVTTGEFTLPNNWSVDITWEP